MLALRWCSADPIVLATTLVLLGRFPWLLLDMMGTLSSALLLDMPVLFTPQPPPCFQELLYG